MPYGGSIHSTVNADLIEADVAAIVEGLAGPGGKTLTDLDGGLGDLATCLTGNGSGVLAAIRGQLQAGLFDLAETPYLDEVRRALFNPDNQVSWVEYIVGDLGTYLYDNNHNQSWLSTLDANIDWLITTHFYDTGASQPWLESIYAGISSLNTHLSAIRDVLTDVHDAAQHALKTV